MQDVSSTMVVPKLVSHHSGVGRLNSRHGEPTIIVTGYETMHTNITKRSLSLIGVLIVLTVAGVAIPGAVSAQDAGNNETAAGNDTSTANGTVVTVTDTTNGTTTADAAGNVSITADPDAAGATANHTVNVTVGSAAAGNLTAMTINYSDSNASTTGTIGYIETANLSGESILDNVTGSTASNDETVEIMFDLNRSLQPGDELTFVYERVQNPPEPGTYPIDVLINPQNASVSLTTNLTITESETTPAVDGSETTTDGGNTTEEIGDDETTTEAAAADEITPETTTTEETTAEETTTGGETTTSGNGPGFTTTVAIVGVIVAALFGMRRE